jgi:ABC-2 type transport system ATP-binding protein
VKDLLIRLEQLEKRFPRSDRPALAGMSAEIKPGIITGLIGPDGAGKTTLMRLLAGLLRPSSGHIIVEEKGSPSESSIHGQTLAKGNRNWIGYMPQRFGLYEDLSVRENLQLHADLRGVIGQERVDAFARLLKFTELDEFQSRLAGKLSGGMKQKLGLACALLGQPRLLLLDEPSVGVDPISRRELWKMVQELIEQGLTVVWSTAYLDEAELCREVLLLNQGELLFAGPPNQLTDRMQERCWQIRKVQGNQRQLLMRALRRPEILDGVIQGHSVRLVMRPGHGRPNTEALGAGAQAEVVRVAPRFEDGFMDALGGKPEVESGLAQHLHPAPTAVEAVVEAVDLTKNFGDFVATDHVSFQVNRGEIFGLLGPNGAGKSTTFRMMCGLLLPTSGKARVMGIDLRSSANRARQRLGYMAQKFSLYANLTVAQNLEFFSGIYGLRGAERTKAIQNMVAVFKLEAFLDTTPDTLPLGFKQRLALACALMHQPDVLFLDEPTSGVDPVTRREFWSHINGLVERGVTVMVTTHFMDEAEYCDRIALIFRGGVIAAGTPDELKEQGRTPTNPEPSMEDAFVELVQRHTPERA